MDVMGRPNALAGDFLLGAIQQCRRVDVKKTLQAKQKIHGVFLYKLLEYL